MKINGREVPGPLIDFGVLMFHNAQILAKLDSGPFFYLSKVESALEASLWNDIFTWAEEKLSPSIWLAQQIILNNFFNR